MPKFDPDNYVPAFKRKPPLIINGHLPQLQPRNDTRPEALNRAVEMARKRKSNRLISGHSLVAGSVGR